MTSPGEKKKIPLELLVMAVHLHLGVLLYRNWQVRRGVTIYTVVIDPNRKDKTGFGNTYVDSSDQLGRFLVLPCSLVTAQMQQSHLRTM